jgi:tryptophanyl-tRNA synthetase
LLHKQLAISYNEGYMRDKPVILTGIRANNDLHIGNYFGALLPLIDMAVRRSGEYQVNMFVPDLHSFTTPIDHTQLRAQIMHNLKLFVAAGLPLDNPDIFIYRQSYVPAHAELTWILDCFTGMGEMSRMTQYKDKSAKLLSQATDTDAGSTHDDESHNRISVGLFNYPVLMAADMLLYNAEYVPVGDDQSQHIEFTRDIAERMNSKFIDAFPDGIFSLPQPVQKQHAFFGKDQGLRIRDLQNPTKKMSKSDESSRGIIFLGDAPDDAAKKVMSATTDSEASIHLDWAKQPGVSNLLQIVALLDQQDVAEVAKQWEGKSSYGELKQAVAERMRRFLTEFQAKLSGVDETALATKLEDSEVAMRDMANMTLRKAQQAVGLRPLSQT